MKFYQILCITIIIIMIASLTACGGSDEGGDTSGENACTFETQQVISPYEWKQVCFNIDSEKACKAIAQSNSTYRNIKYNPGYICG